MNITILILAGLMFAVLGSYAFTAATANVNLNRYADMEIKLYPVGAALHIYRDTNVGVDPAGYLKPFVPGDVFVGVAYEEKDNSAGAAGALSCRVRMDGDFDLAITSVALTDIGSPVFCTDDQTYGLSGHPDAFFGYIIHYTSSGIATVRMRRTGVLPPVGIGNVLVDVDFAKLLHGEVITAGNEMYVNGLRLDSIGAGITTGAGIAPDPANGEEYMLLDNDSEAQNLSIETARCFNVAKGVTFECEGRLKTAGGAATDDVTIGLLGGIAITDAIRADCDVATAGIKTAKLHLNANANDIFAASDDDVSPVAAADTTIDNSLTVNKKFKIIVRPTGVVEFWINGARVLSSTAFSVSATGLLAGILNIEKSTGAGVPELRWKRLRVAGAVA